MRSIVSLRRQTVRGGRAADGTPVVPFIHIDFIIVCELRFHRPILLPSTPEGQRLVKNLAPIKVTMLGDVVVNSSEQVAVNGGADLDAVALGRGHDNSLLLDPSR